MEDKLSQIQQLKQVIANGGETSGSVFDSSLNDPLIHVLRDDGYGMCKAVHSDEFFEVGQALQTAKFEAEQIRQVDQLEYTLHAVPLDKASIRISVEAKGKSLTADQMFDKLTAGLDEPLADIEGGEKVVRDAIARSIKEGTNQERFVFQIKCSDVGRDELLSITGIIRPRMLKGDMSVVARQLRAMADAFEDDDV